MLRTTYVIEGGRRRRHKHMGLTSRSRYDSMITACAMCSGLCLCLCCRVSCCPDWRMSLL
jgi:hypothetical protein